MHCAPEEVNAIALPHSDEGERSFSVAWWKFAVSICSEVSPVGMAAVLSPEMPELPLPLQPVFTESAIEHRAASAL